MDVGLHTWDKSLIPRGHGAWLPFEKFQLASKPILPLAVCQAHNKCPRGKTSVTNGIVVFVEEVTFSIPCGTQGQK